MLRELFEKLDRIIQQENLARFKSGEGEGSIKPCSFHVLGQLALLEVKISSVATRDCDAKTDGEFWVRQKFNELLEERGLVWDPHSHEVQMPKETEYDDLYLGKFVKAEIAKPEYIILSKALYAPRKNRGVFEEYIARGVSKIFLELCNKYKINLKDLLEQDT